jgi:anti-sigma-K factor RskA
MWWLVWAVVAVFCLAAAVYFSGRERQYVQESTGLRRQLESSTATLSEWKQAFSILGSPGVRAASLNAAANGPAANLFYGPVRGLVIVAAHLPPLPAGKAFELWIEQRDGSFAGTGVFRRDNDGTAVHADTNAVLPAAGRIEITLENEGGAARPSSERIFEAEIAPSSR